MHKNGRGAISQHTLTVLIFFLKTEWRILINWHVFSKLVICSGGRICEATRALGPEKNEVRDSCQELNNNIMFITMNYRQ